MLKLSPLIKCLVVTLMIIALVAANHVLGNIEECAKQFPCSTEIVEEEHICATYLPKPDLPIAIEVPNDKCYETVECIFGNSDLSVCKSGGCDMDDKFCGIGPLLP